MVAESRRISAMASPLSPVNAPSWKRLVPSSIRNIYRTGCRYANRLDLSEFIDGALHAVAPAIYRTRKEKWEFAWQRDHWAKLYRDPSVKAKAREYWNQYRFLSEIRQIVAFDDQTGVLDVGCGISTVLEFVRGRRYGVDPLADRYRTIYEYPEDLHIQRAYGESLPFSDNAFDVVFCSNCIDHTESPMRLVAEVDRVLRPGGHFILTCEVFSAAGGSRNAGHPHSMSQDQLLGLVSRFELLRHWDSPWYGLRLYALGASPSDQREHILLLRKRGR
jgi:SAM-dependent methyltransferase